LDQGKMGTERPENFLCIRFTSRELKHPCPTDRQRTPNCAQAAGLLLFGDISNTLLEPYAAEVKFVCRRCRFSLLGLHWRLLLERLARVPQIRFTLDSSIFSSSQSNISQSDPRNSIILCGGFPEVVGIREWSPVPQKY